MMGRQQMFYLGVDTTRCNHRRLLQLQQKSAVSYGRHEESMEHVCVVG